MSLLRIDFSAVEHLIRDFDVKLYKLPHRVQTELITTASEYVLKEIKTNARSMARGKYSLPETDARTIANAAYIDKRHIDDLTPYAEINFKGTVDRYYEPRDVHPIRLKNGNWFYSKKTGVIKNGRRRVAEIAFLNEYGVPKNENQKARGYLLKAMNTGMVKALNPLLNIIENYIADSLAKSV